MNSRRDLRFLLLTDIDHTLVNHSQDNHEDLLQFGRIWQMRFSHDSLLVYSTGRSPFKYDQLKEKAPMITPDVLVCSVGSEIYWKQESGLFIKDQEWNAILDLNWNREKIFQFMNSIEFDQLTLQENSEQRPHKISFNVKLKTEDPSEAKDIVSTVQGGLDNLGVNVNVIFSGGGHYLDILSEKAGKGGALRYLLNKLRSLECYPREGVQVNGDSGNDIELFEVDGVKGCIVANAISELGNWAQENSTLKHLFLATEDCAAGILQGMQHFGLLYETLDDHVQLRTFIFESLESFLHNSINIEGFATDHFTVFVENEQIPKPEGPWNVANVLQLQDAPFMFMDQFHMITNESKNTYQAVFDIYQCAKLNDVKYVISSTLDMQRDNNTLMWISLHFKDEKKSSLIHLIE